MQKEYIVDGVSKEIEWWLDQRIKKIREDRHDTMEINPFMAPLIFAIHGHESFYDLADFLLGGHFSIGHATGFGKLIDEKILPKVFGTIKLDKKLRSRGIFNEACFDNIDHVVNKNGKEYLLSLKASKWTIQLGQAVELNRSFKEIRDLFFAAQHTHDHIIIATFYGKTENLTDKYRLVKGISFGADHKVYNLENYVTVLSGVRFWSWLGDHPDTQFWVLEGILKGIERRKEALQEAQELMHNFRKSFSDKYSRFINKDHTINWKGFLEHSNG
ncbi:MAG: PmeII family type II restriction endonuclease [Liquorilactobacillus satsumensis]|uniref:PmeII family type II restriction endonuclease n=1 Tax=Liquorilactobacillus satsumensis TaxID=259059 RepID=UPI0039EA3B50